MTEPFNPRDYPIEGYVWDDEPGTRRVVTVRMFYTDDDKDRDEMWGEIDIGKFPVPPVDGLIFYITETGDIVLPPPYTQEELDAADVEARRLVFLFEEAFSDVKEIERYPKPKSDLN